MTETEWISCTDPEAMWVHLYYSKSNSRKLSLFACACLRRIWHLLTDERCRRAVEVVEQEADGQEITWEELRPIHQAALVGWDAQAEAADDQNYGTPLSRAMPDAGLAAYHLIDGDLQCVDNASDAVASLVAPQQDPCWQRAKAEEKREQVRLLRCIFHNPFCPVNLSSAVQGWNDGLVVRLARSAYEERHLPGGTLDNGRLMILADALEEAGCTDAEILSHLRGPGPHVRGCWVVDTLLGAELVSFTTF